MKLAYNKYDHKKNSYSHEIDCFHDGTISVENYYVNNMLHRDDGPATISYFLNGKVMLEYYFKNGLQHNDKGPATIKYNADGSIKMVEYWVEGIQYFDMLEYSVSAAMSQGRC